MKAKSYKRLDFIEVTDEKNGIKYICLNCTNEDYETCFMWTERDCKEYLKQNPPVKIIEL